MLVSYVWRTDRRGEDAVHRRVDTEVVLHDFARQVHALPTSSGGAPAIGIVARVVRVPAAVNQQVSTAAIPGKAAPGLDDLGRTGLESVRLGAQFYGRPGLFEPVLVDLEPPAFLDHREFVQQGCEQRALTGTATEFGAGWIGEQ
jgi:hypothetical protein